MISKVFVLILYLSIPYWASAQFPQTVKRCGRRDPNFKDCFITAYSEFIHTEHAPVPYLGLPNLSPLSFSSLDIAAGHGPVDFAQHFEDCQMFGQDLAIVDELTHFDFENRELIISELIPKFSLVCKYHIDGKIMTSPIMGAGTSNITMVDLKVLSRFRLSEYQKGGKSYFRSEECKLKLAPRKIIYRFNDLFNGDAELGEHINAVLNEHWEEIFHDIEDEYEKGLGMIFNELANDVFSRVPIVELFLN